MQSVRMRAAPVVARAGAVAAGGATGKIEGDGQASRSGTYRFWMALRLGGSLAVLLGCMTSAFAASQDSQRQNDLAGQSPVLLAQAGTTARQFDIPAQALASALVAYSDVTGIQFFFDSSLARGLQSPGVSGSMKAEDALRQLLAGTGMTYRFTNAGTVTLEKLPAQQGALNLAPVLVEGARTAPSTAMLDSPPPAYAGGQVATGGQVGLLGNRDVMDTPFSTINYTKKLIQDQQARSLADIIDNDPSIRNIWSSSSYSNQFMIRGFPVYNDDVAFNGLYGLMPRQIIAAEMAERVEIFKGPNALLNGVNPSGTVGGGINIVSKHAEDDPLTQLTATYASDAQFGGQVDVGRRFGPNKELGLRFNGSYRDGDTAIDHQEQEFGLAMLGADYRGERLRLSLDVGYQDQDFTAGLSQINVAPGVDIPDAPKASHNFMDKWAYSETKDLFGLVRGEYDVTDDVTVFAAIGARDSDQESVGRWVTINNENGDFSGATNSFPFYQKALSAQVGGRAAIDLDGMRHELSLTASTLRMTQGYGFVYGTDNPSNIYDPVPVDNPHFGHVPTGKSADTVLNSIALADVMSFVDDRIQLTVGGRVQQIKVDNFDVNSGDKTAAYNEAAVTPAVGLLVKPWENVSVYGNYIEGLAQGPTAPAGTVNNGEIFAPSRTHQYEVGVKVDFGRLTTTLAAFQITQPSSYTDAATNKFVVDGEQRNRGLELSAFGEVIDSVRLLGGVTLIDGDLTKTAGGANDGNTAIGVPSLQANVSGEWDTPFIPGFTLTGRMIYTSGQYLDAGNTQKIPDWFRLDLGARYSVDVRETVVTIRANVENVLDNDYWSSTGGGYLALGAPRTFLVSTSVNF
ncbi:MAG: TonB-dependent receptor [Rhodospirillaceae bacterium]|nr:MAG: TonB-dependent receptor [Rhodospirillaceae bacterium]